jgi:hypothetical protein
MFQAMRNFSVYQRDWQKVYRSRAKQNEKAPSDANHLAGLKLVALSSLQ